MSSGAVESRTSGIGLAKLRFNFPNWGDEANNNMTIIDALLSPLTGTLSGPWLNSTAYAVGARVIDSITDTIYVAAVAHSSPATGTFAEARAAQPTYWTSVAGVPTFRGTWTTGIQYYVNDFVVNGYLYGVAKSSFVSGASYAADVADGKFATLIDFTTPVGDALTHSINSGISAGVANIHSDNAAASAASATASASAAAGSASAAGTSATNAAGSATAANTSNVNAATSEANALVYQNNANTYSTNALTYQNNALAYRNDAYTFSQNAAASAALAMAATPASTIALAADRAQCRFEFIGLAFVRLVPHNGDRFLMPDGISYQIPSGGVTLTNAGFAASSSYYVFAYMSGSTMALSARLQSTGLASNALGQTISAVNANEVLVGSVFTNSFAQFQSDLGFRGVASFFNKKQIEFSLSLGSLSTTSTTIVQLGSQLTMTGFVGDLVNITIIGQCNVTAGSSFGVLYASVDGSTTDLPFHIVYQSADAHPVAVVTYTSLISNGGHGFVLLGRLDAAGTLLVNNVWFSGWYMG